MKMIRLAYNRGDRRTRKKQEGYKAKEEKVRGMGNRVAKNRESQQPEG